jgi:uncharacterized protein (TIGR03435 family)
MKKGRAVLMMFALAGSMAAQQPAAEKKLSFEVVSIRRAAPGSFARNSTTIVNPRRITMQNINLVWLTYYAYGVGLGTAVRVTGGPDWKDRDTFDIQAVASQDSVERDFRIMVRTMLEERFALKVRVENQTAPNILGLFLDRSDGKLGPNVREWTGTCFNDRRPVDDDDPTIARCPSGYFRPGLLLQGVTMFNVADILSLPQSRNLLGTIVTDHTGLKGRYDLRLEFAFPPIGAPPTVVAPSLESAIREQWGLKIERASGPFKLVTIDSAERPTEN